jgi:hypothetical protein
VLNYVLSVRAAEDKGQKCKSLAAPSPGLPARSSAAHGNCATGAVFTSPAGIPEKSIKIEKNG